jgi:hypothetical protein
MTPPRDGASGCARAWGSTVTPAELRMSAEQQRELMREAVRDEWTEEEKAAFKEANGGS